MGVGVGYLGMATEDLDIGAGVSSPALRDLGPTTEELGRAIMDLGRMLMAWE